MATRPQLTRAALALLSLAPLAGLGCRGGDAAGGLLSGVTASGHVQNAGQARLVTTWSNRVVETPDPTKAGVPVTGLAGRVYLFAPGCEVPTGMGDGTLLVRVYDHTAAKGQPIQPKLLEQWTIDPVNLARLEKKDIFGVGYTVFLPWATYRPDIARVYVEATLMRPGQEVVMAPGSPLGLDHSGRQTVWQAAGTAPLPTLGPTPPPALGPLPATDIPPPLKLPDAGSTELPAPRPGV